MMQACFFFLVLRIEPRASHFLGKHYHWSHAPNPFACVFVFEMGVSLTFAQTSLEHWILLPRLLEYLGLQVFAATLS
jgi:hypothetical protein